MLDILDVNCLVEITFKMRCHNFSICCAVFLGIFTNCCFGTSSWLISNHVHIKREDGALIGHLKFRFNTPSITRCAQLCMRTSFDICKSFNYDSKNKVCDLNDDVEYGNEGDMLSTSGVNYYEINLIVHRHGGLIVAKKSMTYTQASNECAQLKASLAYYEELITVVEQGVDVPCFQGWLWNGEIAFTEIDGSCDLKPAANRCNVFPERTSLYPGGYCSIAESPSYDEYRLLRLTGDAVEKLTYERASNRCREEFGGHLAGPMEIVNVSKSGVNTCNRTWIANGLLWSPDTTSTDCWSELEKGNKLWIPDHNDKTKENAFCFQPPMGYVEPDHWPAHRVFNVRGGSSTSFSLTYTEACERCLGVGASMANFSQLDAARVSGYDMCKRGWIEDGRVGYPATWKRQACGSIVGIKITHENNVHSCFCYISETEMILSDCK